MLENIMKYNNTVQITRNSLVYCQLKAAMQNDIKILELDKVKYTFKELMDLPNEADYEFDTNFDPNQEL